MLGVQATCVPGSSWDLVVPEDAVIKTGEVEVPHKDLNEEEEQALESPGHLVPLGPSMKGYGRAIVRRSLSFRKVTLNVPSFSILRSAIKGTEVLCPLCICPILTRFVIGCCDGQGGGGRGMVKLDVTNCFLSFYFPNPPWARFVSRVWGM